MKRIVAFITTFTVYFIARQFFRTTMSGGPSASHAGAPAVQSSPNGLITQKLVTLFQSTGGAHLSRLDMRTVSLAVFVYSFAVGLCAHVLLGDKGFGRGFNGLIALFGAGLAITALAWLAPQMGEYGFGLTIGVTILSSLLCLGAAVALKVFIVSEVRGFATGAGTRTGEAMRALRSGPQPNAVSQDRIQRALRKS